MLKSESCRSNAAFASLPAASAAVLGTGVPVAFSSPRPESETDGIGCAAALWLV